MLRITKSLFAIVAIAAMAIGATGAYFSDTATIAGNSFTTGSIHIRVDGLPNPAGHFTFTGMKPDYFQYSDFTVTNTGTNPANITKKVTLVSDPGNLATVIDYKLSVVVSNGWNQMLYNYNTTLADIQGTEMFLGMLPVGMTMQVNESYKMKAETDGAQYQDQTMSFDIAVKAEQLKGILTLENKTGDPDWQIVRDANTGILTYGVMDKTFKFDFTGVAPQANTNYTLVIGSEPYASGGTTLGTGLTDGARNITIPTTSVNLPTVINQKVWLILSTDWNGTNMTGWHQPDYLTETGLIDYYKSL